MGWMEQGSSVEEILKMQQKEEVGEAGVKVEVLKTSQLGSVKSNFNLYP